MPSDTSPNDLLSITTFHNTEEDVAKRDKSRHVACIPREETVGTSVDDKKKEDLVKDQVDVDNDNIHDNETGKLDDTGHSLGKRKLGSEKLPLTDESGIKVKKRKISTNQNVADQHNNDIENQEASSKDISSSNRNKITEADKKKKKRLSINDTFKSEDINEEAIKKDPRGSAIKLDKNKAVGTTSADKSYDDKNNKKGTVLQSIKHSTKKNIDVADSNIEEKETGVDERKKKKNRKKRSNFQKDITSDMMQVMAKRDWKRLRNKYLELQKSKMQQLKLHLKKARWNYDKTGQNYERSKHEKDDDDKTMETEQSRYGRTAYAPGIIVKIEMTEPCTDPQRLRVYFYFVVINRAVFHTSFHFN